MKVTIGIILGNGFPVPAPFVISWSHLLQTMATGIENDASPRTTSAQAHHIGHRELALGLTPLGQPRQPPCPLAR